MLPMDAQGNVSPSKAWMWVAGVLSLVLVLLALVSRPLVMPHGVLMQHARAFAIQGEVPFQARQVSLPHVWDNESPAFEGELSYELDWPQAVFDAAAVEAAQADGWALLMPRVGARFRVLLDGQIVHSAYWDAQDYVDTSVVPHWVALPVQLDMTHPHQLQIQVRGVLLRKSGLGPVTLAPAGLVKDRFDRLYWWQVYLTWMVAACSGMLSLLTALVWLTGRERVFALLSIASLAWMLRLALTPLVHPAMPFELWFFLHKWSFTVYCGFLYLFWWDLFDLQQYWQRRVVRFMVWISPLWIGLTVLSGSYGAYRVWTGCFALVAVISVGMMIHRSRRGLDSNQRLMGVVSLVTLITGLRDFFVVQFGAMGDADLRWMTPGSLVFMLALSLVLVQRMSNYVREIQALNADLESRVREKEQELRAAFEQIHEVEKQKVLIGERARLTRDMHDGLGSQLVQTLNALRGATPVSKEAIEQMLGYALEELRMTIDSMEPMEGDLPTILGTLRRRIGSTLEAAGIDLQWEVQEVPALLDIQGKPMEAKAVMHLFRCLQEVFANIIKHANATQVRVRTGLSAQGVELCIIDDGAGLGAGFRDGGRGLGNIRMRVNMLGARVYWLNADPGTEVKFVFEHHSGGEAGGVAEQK